MGNTDPPDAHLVEIVTSTAPLLERAQGVLEELGVSVPSEATWLALADPWSNVHATVGSTGLDQPVLDYLGRPSVAREIQRAGLNRAMPPFSLGQLPTPADELPTWSECLIPAGFHEALGVPLFEPGAPTSACSPCCSPAGGLRLQRRATGSRSSRR